MADAYYLPDDDQGRFVATDLCGGPWDPDFSHGGPPAALLARAVERTPATWEFTVVRMAVEILGPVPLGPITVTSAVVRPGRSVDLVEAELTAGGRVAVRARAWRVRIAPLDGLPTDVATPPRTPALPDSDDPPAQGWPGQFMHSLQTRFSRGGWNSLGPATLWARQRVGLVSGEPSTGLQRLMVLADCGNGISNSLPIADWVFINPDLTVHLSRQPDGEWLCLDAVTTVDPSGFGLAASTLHDAAGQVGVGAQSLFVSRR